MGTFWEVSFEEDHRNSNGIANIEAESQIWRKAQLATKIMRLSLVMDFENSCQ